MKIIKAKAPLRVSFAGGGTDIEPYLSDYGSYVLSGAINLYSRAMFPGHTPDNDIEKILSSMTDGKPIQILSDVVPEAGLGGSASCYIAGMKCLYPQLNNDQIIYLAYFLERKVQGIKGGIQDQICAALGGLLFITMEHNHLGIERLENIDQLEKYLVMVNTGPRLKSGNEIIEDQLRCYNVKALHRQKQIARLMKEAFIAKDFINFGLLLKESWEVKKEQSCLVSDERIENLYTLSLECGAIGGVLTGAGAGGYFLLMEHPDKEGELRQNLVKHEIAYHNVVFDHIGARIE